MVAVEEALTFVIYLALRAVVCELVEALVFRLHEQTSLVVDDAVLGVGHIVFLLYRCVFAA